MLDKLSSANNMVEYLGTLNQGVCGTSGNFVLLLAGFQHSTRSETK
jgi:hypothetical protein